MPGSPNNGVDLGNRLQADDLEVTQQKRKPSLPFGFRPEQRRENAWGARLPTSLELVHFATTVNCCISEVQNESSHSCIQRIDLRMQFPGQDAFSAAKGSGS